MAKEVGLNRINNTNSFKSDVKRFSIPHAFFIDCKNCNERLEIDLNSFNILSYPEFNKEFKFGFCCHECSCEMSIPMFIGIQVGYDTRRLKIESD